jgi:flagellum-specific peptidoglycan hydrolase FlgJ
VKPSWKGRKYCKQTLEYENGRPVKVDDCFRRYSYIRESYWDFGAFITGQDHYNWMLDLSPEDLAGWANGLQQGGYATDPAYAQKLMRLIDTYGLDEIE